MNKTFKIARIFKKIFLNKYITLIKIFISNYYLNFYYYLKFYLIILSNLLFIIYNIKKNLR